MNNKYGGVIWTNHALQRLQERNISQGDAWAAWSHPDSSRYESSKGTWIYNRVLNNTAIEIVAKQNERKEWLILSVWSKPVYQKYNSGKISFWRFIYNKLFKV